MQNWWIVAHDVDFTPCDSAVGPREIGGIVAHDADFTSCNFNRRVVRNWWDRGL